MHHELSRRDFLRVAASVGAVGAGAVLLGACGSDESNGSATSTPGIVVDPPPETTTIRLPNALPPRMAPFFVAGQFLAAEGFTDVQYIPDHAPYHEQITSGEIDIGMPFPEGLTVAADAGDPLVALAGVPNSLFVIFGNDQVQSLRDIKGKRIATYGDQGIYILYAALLAYVGIDVDTEVEFVEVNFLDVVGKAQEGAFDVWTAIPPSSTIFRAQNIGHVIVDGKVDPPWSQYFGAMVTGNGDFIEKNPAATKRALRAIMKATDVCATEPERAARYLVDKGYWTVSYDLALYAIKEVSYATWREFNPADTMRFYALRLNEAGLVKSNPDELIARATDFHFLNEIKRELGVA
jgi:NitT/TauT family transport system substrate-binding protein